MVLSPGGPASPELYQHHLAGVFERYYLINHDNTEHAHVHVIGFRTTTLRREQLREQQQQLTQRVAQERELEQERHRSRGSGSGLGL